MPASMNTMGATSFTITQSFLGAPLQFTPALGSQELESLVDAYVAGDAPKQDKLSEVTIDFYKFATVDISTGSLVRRYDVFPAPFASSPSASFSPPTFTRSPSSGYTSSFVAPTPPIATAAYRARGTRVAKKPTKKEAKSAAERLPGFSIMTKDGVDVTTSAGRGTKTKEQREHAHLMRIMKACDACKKKKIRCDPSHRRANTAMSRTSTKTSSPSKSPTISTPSLHQQSSFASNESMSSFAAPTAVNDFVLFPETPSLEWNPADIVDPFPESQASELIDFDFDINSIGGLNNFPDQFFDFPAYGAESKLQSAQPFDYSQYTPDQFVFDQFDTNDFMPVSHTLNSYPSSSGYDSGSHQASPSDLPGSLPVGPLPSLHTPTPGSPSGASPDTSSLNTPSLQNSSIGSPQDWSPEGHVPISPDRGASANGLRPTPSSYTSRQSQGVNAQENLAVSTWNLLDSSVEAAVDHISHAEPGDQAQRPRHNRLDRRERDKRLSVSHEQFENSDSVAVANHIEGSQVVVESLRSGSNLASQLSTQPRLLLSEVRYRSTLATSSDESRSLHQDRQSGEDNGHYTLAGTKLRLSEDCNLHEIQTRSQNANTRFYLPAPFIVSQIARQSISGGNIGVDQQISHFAVTEIESPQSVLCRTVPSLQTTASPLQTNSSAHPSAKDTTIPSTVTTMTSGDAQYRSLVMVAVLASITIAALPYLGSYATVAEMLLSCVAPFVMALMAKTVLQSCMDLASDMTSTLSSTTMMSGSGLPSVKAIAAGRTVVSKCFDGNSGRKSRMNVCRSLRVQ